MGSSSCRTFGQLAGVVEVQTTPVLWYFFFFSFFFFPFLFCSEVGGVGACQECSVRLEEAGEKEKKKKNRSNQYKVALRRASLTLKTEGARPAATSST